MSTDNKTMTGVITGAIVGLLVAGGYVSPNNADQLQQLLDTIGGLILTIISLIYFFEHQTLTKKAELSTQYPVANMTPLADITLKATTTPAQ